MSKNILLKCIVNCDSWYYRTYANSPNIFFANKFVTFNFFGDAVYIGIHEETKKLNVDKFSGKR